MSSTATGQLAEGVVTEHLKAQGFSILARNWKTKVCEIDIIARKDNVVYFTEVKFRSSESQGDGLAYITPTKLKRLHFAAQVWLKYSGWSGDWRLLAASVTGDGAKYWVKDLVELE